MTIASTPLGTVWPARPAQPLPDIGPREGALRALRDFIGGLVFRRTMAPGEAPRGFRLGPDRIHLFQPDDVVDQKLPSLAFVSTAGGTYDYYGLGPPEIQNGTADKFAPGTALYRIADFVETFTIEIWSAKHATRRAIAEGFAAAAGAWEESQALRLRMPEYFDEIVEFNVEGVTYPEEPDAVRNRRRALIQITMRSPLVVLANVVDLKPLIYFGGPGEPFITDVQVETSGST